MTWVYEKTEPRLWTVGFYDPEGKWQTDSDWDVREDAVRRVVYLNGGTPLYGAEKPQEKLDRLFGMLVDAAEAEQGAPIEPLDLRFALREYRAGLQSAYALMSGKSEEEVYETVQEVLQARHERIIAEQDA